MIQFPSCPNCSPSMPTPLFIVPQYIFMRWKEYFLVPNHRVKELTGASFDGFYYICFSQLNGSVSGIYFHSNSEKWQQLELKHVPDRGFFGSIEFRWITRPENIQFQDKTNISLNLPPQDKNSKKFKNYFQGQLRCLWEFSPNSWLSRIYTHFYIR